MRVLFFVTFIKTWFRKSEIKDVVKYYGYLDKLLMGPFEYFSLAVRVQVGFKGVTIPMRIVRMMLGSAAAGF